MSHSNETSIERTKRHEREKRRQGVVLSAIAGFTIFTVVKYLPNNLTSDSVKPPTTTEQVVENNTQTVDNNINLAK